MGDGECLGFHFRLIIPRDNMSTALPVFPPCQDVSVLSEECPVESGGLIFVYSFFFSFLA